jgi:hypothetical protein
LVLISDDILLCFELHVLGIEEGEYLNREFLVGLVKPIFPLQNSSLTNFVAYLGDVIRASTIKFVGWDSIVWVATRYGLDFLGIKSWWKRDFLHYSRLSLGPIQPLVQWIMCHSQQSNGSQVVALISPFPLHNTKVKERVQLYLYSSSGPS